MKWIPKTNHNWEICQFKLSARQLVVQHNPICSTQHSKENCTIGGGQNRNVWNCFWRNFVFGRVFRLSGSTDWARLSVRSAVFDSFMAQCVCTAHTHTHAHMKRMWVREEGGGRSDARILLKGECTKKKKKKLVRLPLGTTAGNIWRARCSTTTKVVVSCCSCCRCWTSQTPISFFFFFFLFGWLVCLLDHFGGEFTGRRDTTLLFFSPPCPEFH